MTDRKYNVTYCSLSCTTHRSCVCDGVLTLRERNISISRSAVRPQLEWRATPVGARGLCCFFFSFPPFCPAGRMGASQPSNPTYPSPPRSRPVLPSHAWPSLGIHSGCFLFIASTPLFLSLLYPSHQAPSNPSLLSLMKHLYFVML